MSAHEHLNKDQSGRYVRLHRGFAGINQKKTLLKSKALYTDFF